MLCGPGSGRGVCKQQHVYSSVVHGNVPLKGDEMPKTEKE